MKTFMIWLVHNVSPAWLFMIFPLMFGWVAFMFWRDYRKQVKLEADPINMTNIEYRRFNNKRFGK